MAKPFTLGINFPWVSCGHDFGPRPPPWSGAGPTDWASVARELEALHALGIRAVRWWIFAGGVNLPVGADPATVADRVPFLDPYPRWRRPFARRGREVPERYAPREPLPPLPRAFLDDYERLLEVCGSSGVRLVPSLLSFELFLPLRSQPKGVTSGGRSAFVLGEHRDAFFDRCLEPLLEVSERHRDAIAAFEIANEPGWALKRGWEKARFGAHPPWIDAYALRTFLVEGARRVARRDLRATIGFVSARPAWLAPSERTSLRRLAERGAYVHQLHHYPKETGARVLPPARESAVLPCWIGELPTAPPARGDRWRDVGLAEDDPDRYLARRIEHAMELGYEGALLWSARATDRHTRWDEVTKAQVGRVARAQRAG